MKKPNFKSIINGIVKNCIESDLKSYGYESGENIYSVYMGEYGNYNGLTPKSCTDYLQGLPTLCTVPFSNFEILELLEKSGYTKTKAEQKDDYLLVEKYWRVAGQCFYDLLIKERDKIRSKYTAAEILESAVRLDNDTNGNPRYYIPCFLFIDSKDDTMFRPKYATAYRGKKYGSGWVFQSYCLERDLELAIEGV